MRDHMNHPDIVKTHPGYQLSKAKLLSQIRLFPSVQPCAQKHFAFSSPQITRIYHPSRPTEGRLAIVTNAGRDAVDAKALLTNGAEADGEGVWS